ncbi:MAG: nitrile hydratase beta subunit [Ascidiaceihabitans sp.]|jgi:nitrile hydratase beta subunit
MSRVHDMGGRFGDGAVVPEAETDPIFHEAWHARALALVLSTGAWGQWNIDISRHARECLSPQDYMAMSYYEKWLAGAAALCVENDILTRDELASGQANGTSVLAAKALKSENVAPMLAAGGPANRPSEIAINFKVGQAVKTRKIASNQMVDGGHTRLPNYAAGAQGRIILIHGTHILPDSSAHRLGEGSEPLYAVAIPASELWAQPEHPKDEVILDLWQSYLEPA